MAGTKTILLTGASGVVGRAIAAELRSRCIALVHVNDSVPEADEILASDISAPRLGLDRGEWDRLARDVDVIIHSAALTEWGQARDRYEAINVGGMRGVIELAESARAPVHLISTIFVLALNGSSSGLRDDNLVRNYIQSKLESERLLHDSGVPHTLFRPTNLVGDSRTGASLRPQIVQALSDFISRGKAPYFPSHAENLVDVAPLDALSIPAARAAERDVLGETFYVSYGEHAMSVQTAIRVLGEHARSLGREVGDAPIVDPRETLPVPLEKISSTSRPFMRVGIDVSEVTYASGGVLPSSLPELSERFGVPHIPAEEAFRRSLAYWAAQRGQLTRQESRA